MSESQSNGQIAAFFDRIAALMELRGDNVFKRRAYARAAEAIRTLPRDIHEDYRRGTLTDIPAIGDAISAKIGEIIESGGLDFLRRLEAEVPAGVATLLQVPEIGPKSAMAIYETLAITSLEMLEEAAAAGRLQEVPGIGARSEQQILEGIAALRRRTNRHLLGHLLPRAQDLLVSLREQAGPLLLQAALTGSLRRQQATVGDINLLTAAAPKSWDPLLSAFTALPHILRTEAIAADRLVAALHSGERVTLQVVDPAQWGGALLLQTGSAAHLETLRAHAAAQGLESLFPTPDAPGNVARERTLYESLALEWIPPELREGSGEVPAAASGALPALVEVEDLRGDLHLHSTWSDGKGSIQEMADAARALGYEYIVVTDHSQSLAMTGGLSPERLIEQRYEIINVNARYDDFAVLQGAEVEIKADGTLDYPDEILANLDVVVASMHTGTRGDRETLTRRMLSAIQNPHVDVIGHMTNRLIGRREGADLDMDAVLAAAAESGTILEINAQPERLDLSPEHARAALEAGCLLSIGSDAHLPDGLTGIALGISQARRAWAEADDIINSRPLDEFLSYIRSRT